MKTYHAYIRVSTVKQGERGSSLVEQKSAIEAYAARHNLTISGWFEEMETAAKQGRRAFARLLAELKTGKADGLIIHKIDRSARNLRDWADLGDLIDRGVDVRFVSDNFDLLSRGGRLSADIQAVVAADYIRNLREEVKKGMYGRLKQGFYPFGAPLGYRDNGRAAVKTIDPVTGPLVQELFERYATNTVGFRRLRLEMADKGLRTKSGKPFYPRTLTTVLHNPFYMGVIRLGTTGETFPGAHEPLISKALFDRVQAILRAKTVPKGKMHRFLLRQMVRCTECNRRTLTGERHKGHIYYRCHICPGVSWRGDVLESIISGHVRRIRLNDRDSGDLRDLIAAEFLSSHADRERLVVSLGLRLSKLDARLARLTELLLDDAIDRNAYNVQRESLLMQRQGLLGELERAKRHSPLQSLFEEFERQNNQLLGYESLTDDEKRKMVDIVCSNFSVSGNP
jgi:DNA invertase Pin-like site-specific DNA recombinase